MDDHLRDRTEVPSINGGLPITMQVKKEPSFLGGQICGGCARALCTTYPHFKVPVYERSAYLASLSLMPSGKSTRT